MYTKSASPRVLTRPSDAPIFSSVSNAPMNSPTKSAPAAPNFSGPNGIMPNAAPSAIVSESAKSGLSIRNCIVAYPTLCDGQSSRQHPNGEGPVSC